MQEQPLDFEPGDHDVLEDAHDNDFGPEAAGVAAMAPPGGASSGGDPPTLFRGKFS